MKILHSAPIDIQISPDLKYAGTERIVFYLNQGLHETGHTSLVAAPGNSRLGGYGKILPTRDTHLWLTEGNERKMTRSKEAYEDHYQKVIQFAHQENVDIIHDHPGQFIFSSEIYTSSRSQIKIPIIITTHGATGPQCEEKKQKNAGPTKYDILKSLQKENLPLYFVTISNAHRKEHEDIGIKVDGMVYNGVDMNLFPLEQEKQNYLLWLGRLSGIKGTDIAVQVARKTKDPLIIAGEVHDPYKKIFESKINPYITKTIDGPNAEEKKTSLLEKIASGEEGVKEGEIVFLGPVNDKQKAILYSKAKATLQPNRWREPFGLVPVESMATGTPVIVTNTGALPELVKDGETGFIINAYNKKKIDDNQIIEGTIDALDKITSINPQVCRTHIENTFSKEQMTKGYLELYKKIIQNN